MKSISIIVSAAVLLSALAGCAGHCNEREGHEVPVSVNDLPPAVRATLGRESAGGTVTEIERETRDGKVVYSADMLVDGAAWDITISEDGSVLEKEREKAGEK